MKRLTQLIHCLIAVLCLAVPARAEKVYPCGAGATMSYYVLWGHSLAPFSTLNDYTAPDRHVQEIVPREDEAILHGVCEYEVPAFESRHGIVTGSELGPGSELSEVLDAVTKQAVGTVWNDFKEPYDQGGALAYVRYRTCVDPATGKDLGVVNNVGLWSLGLDTSAMNNADAASIELHWTKPIQLLTEGVADFYMENGSGLHCFDTHDLQSFLSLYSGQNVAKHYLQIDPNDGVMMKPGG